MKEAAVKVLRDYPIILILNSGLHCLFVPASVKCRLKAGQTISEKVFFKITDVLNLPVLKTSSTTRLKGFLQQNCLDKIHFLSLYVTQKQMYLCHCSDLSGKMYSLSDTFIDQRKEPSLGNKQWKACRETKDFNICPMQMVINLESLISAVGWLAMLLSCSKLTDKQIYWIAQWITFYECIIVAYIAHKSARSLLSSVNCIYC